jgi:serine/threonine protein kinase
MFVREEYEILQSLAHPSIVKVIDIFEDPCEIWICMELLQGSVKQHVHCYGAFTEARARPLFEKILEGVHYLHGKRIVHRDVKPENILISNCGKEVKLGDFNSAKRLGESHMLTHRSTHIFSAPEYLQGIWNERVDIWAVGMCFFFMLRGALPFVIEHSIRSPVREYFEELLAKVKWDGIARHACHLIQLCLSVDMRDRPSAQALLHHRFLAQHRSRGQPVQRRNSRPLEKSPKFHSCSAQDFTAWEEIAALCSEDEEDVVAQQSRSPYDFMQTGSCINLISRACSYPANLASLN